jgi:hypothetical protein
VSGAPATTATRWRLRQVARSVQHPAAWRPSSWRHAVG